MEAVAVYIDKNGEKKSFFYNTRTFGRHDECIELMEKEGIQPVEIKEINTSD